MKAKKPTSRLKLLRKQKGLTQTQIGDMLDISYQAYQKYENGERDINKMQARSLKKLADILGCDMVELLDLNEY